jgi:hypothetical protein
VLSPQITPGWSVLPGAIAYGWDSKVKAERKAA